jgi:hypothetical protein
MRRPLLSKALLLRRFTVPAAVEGWSGVGVLDNSTVSIDEMESCSNSKVRPVPIVDEPAIATRAPSIMTEVYFGL